MAQAVADGLPALALTDTNVLYGAVAFDRACRKAQIQPLLGMTVTVAPLAAAALSTPPGLLTLLATGPAGYRSLCRLASAVQGHADREARAARGLDWSTLAEHREGLIGLAGGRRGWVERWLRAGDDAQARAYAEALASLYGDCAYLTLERHRAADDGVVEAVVSLAARVGLPMVAVQPVYTMTPNARVRLRLLAAMNLNCLLADVPASALPDQGEEHVDLHWLSPAAMAARFASWPAALDATAAIAAHCAPALPDGRPIWPVLKLPPDQTPTAALATLAEEGLTQRYGAATQTVARARLTHELTMITSQGYAPLFLLVADVVRYARRQAIPVSTRGSVANSLVAYCTGITSVDPLAHDLLFERFLNPERQDPPDIDLDFCSLRRDEVLAYVRATYGPQQVALVATISTLRPKSAVRETAKAYGLAKEQIDRLVARLPDTWHPDPRRRVQSKVEEMLAGFRDPQERRVVMAAYELLGQPHHLSLHPGGVVVTPGPLTDVAPVQWTPKGFLAIQFEHEHVEAIGLPKIDLLGIRALTVLAAATHLIRRDLEPTFQLEQIPLTDEATGVLLATGDTVGVFQCESTGAQRTLRQLKVRTVQDLAVANAFFKPGPATGGMAQTFIRRYRGEAQTFYLHPALAPILAPTHGVLIFQEQILRVAREIAGLSWTEADHLRRGMSKFRADAMEAIRSRFLAGCQRPAPAGPAFSAQQAATLWEQVRAFAGYGFNQGHATAYADVSYRSAYLKAHWPAAFLAARLSTWGGFHHQAIYICEAQRLGIAVRPPHINHSGEHFTLAYPAENQRDDEDGAELEQPQPTLWMGLGQVRSLRRRTVQALLAERPFVDLADLLQRVSLQQKELLHLIRCGALDELGASRAALQAEAKERLQGAQLHQMAFAFARPELPSESPAERLAWEKRILGQPLTVHPLALVQKSGLESVPLTQVATQPGLRVQVLATRLPGWTGDAGFFLGDGDTFVVAQGAKTLRRPKSWTPLLVTGRWRVDEWGGGRLQVEEVTELTA